MSSRHPPRNCQRARFRGRGVGGGVAFCNSNAFKALDCKRVLYELLFRCVSATLLEVAAKPQAIRRRHRLSVRTAHVGTDASSAHPLRRACRGFAPTARTGCDLRPPVSFSRDRSSPGCSEASSTMARKRCSGGRCMSFTDHWPGWRSLVPSRDSCTRCIA